MASSRPVKRRRLSPPPEPRTKRLNGTNTPPETDLDRTPDIDCNLFERATHVLATEAAALTNVTNLYRTSGVARASLVAAVSAIASAQAHGAKLVVTGVGKSAYISMKFVATCKSLGIAASFMHACEAMHGDLGDIRTHDVVLFVSFSGKTPELLNLLPHILAGARVIAMSSQLQRADCALLDDRPDGILLPTPIPEKEETSFGVAAPTTSTTVALAVADMLALSVADRVHAGATKAVFKRNHPGGAIGLKHREVEALVDDGVDFTVLELPSPSISGSDKG